METNNINIRSIGIVGFGRFGALLGRSLREDFQVCAYDSMLTPEKITSKGIEAAPLHEVAQMDCIILCVPIVNFETTVKRLEPLISSETAVLDVCSVKKMPSDVMHEHLSKKAVILPTHPMFGPVSAQFGWDNLPFVLCPSATPSAAEQALTTFWSNYIQQRQRARVVIMTPEEHDRVTAYNLCLTQLLGRVLGNIGIQSSPIDAQSFKYLLQMKEISYSDSMELLIGMHRYNPFAAEMRTRLREEFATVEELLSKKVD
ncbi:MAG: prephenate dehydrogenase/arogenate dehydrogenase family protein [Candidatus Kapaibacterium sp.]|nr:MAG: prephenate dehydrogenase/arogenate dehydrogenase family protein [Candidatus Kapabacteria bacterium]